MIDARECPDCGGQLDCAGECEHCTEDLVRLNPLARRLKAMAELAEMAADDAEYPADSQRFTTIAAELRELIKLLN